MNEISKADREYLQDLLSGKKKTDDRHINYALAAIRERSAMASQLQARHAETAKALESMHRELIALNAEINAKGFDVLEFSKFDETDREP
jgi:hypothetical protein